MTHTANFLEEHGGDAHNHHPHHHSRRRLKKRLVGVLLVVLIVYAGVAALGAGRVIAASLDAKDAMDRAIVAAKDLNFPAATTELDTVSQDIARAKRGLVWLSPLKIIPYVGDQVRAASDVLSASERLMPSLQDAVRIAADVVEVVARAQALTNNQTDMSLSYLSMPADVRHDILLKLHQSEPQLKLMRTRLALAQEDVQKLDQLTLLEPLRQAVEPFRQLIPELSSAVQFLVPVAEIVPEFGGLDDAKKYLVLFENNTELRPGGGFVGNYVGSMTIVDGAIAGIDTEDSYAIDGAVEGRVTTPPPAPLQTYMGVNAWYFRDANWSPDFATSARQSLTLLNDEERLLGQAPTTYDGVIALTPTFAADLLELVGPVSIDGQTFTSENIADTLEYQVEFGFAEQGLPRDQRKEIVDQLSEEVMNRLFHLPLSAWLSVSDVAMQAIAEKQLLVYSANTDTEQALVDAGWAGTLVVNEGHDFLSVVDANLASLKSDPAVARTITYGVKEQTDGTLLADVSIAYTHNGSFDWKTTRYRTYTRVFVPLGSTLVSADGMLENDKLLNPSRKPGVVDVADESGFTTFGAFISIEPGDTGVLHFTYTLPETLSQTIKQGTYQLDVAKQPGAQNNKLTVAVDFGKPLTSATPAEDPSQFGNSQYVVNTVLDRDQQFIVRF